MTCSRLPASTAVSCFEQPLASRASAANQQGRARREGQRLMIAFQGKTKATRGNRVAGNDEAFDPFYLFGVAAASGGRPGAVRVALANCGAWPCTSDSRRSISAILETSCSSIFLRSLLVTML